MKRLKYIFAMILLIAAIQAAGDTYDIDSVCINATRNYRVNGEAGSTYEWLLTDSAGNPVILPNSTGSTFTETTSGTTLYGSEITISWPTPGLFNLMSVQTSVFGCDSIQLGQIKVFDLPFADAGKDAIICPGAPHSFIDATASNYSTLRWTGGDGTFDDATSLTPTYTPGPNDVLAGFVICRLTVQGKGSGATCTPYASIVTLTILKLEAAVLPTAITCYGATDGKIEISGATGGSGSYEFSIDGTTWTSTSEFTNLSKGIYQVRMRDALKPVCFAILEDVEIIEPEQLAADSPPAHTDVTCLGNDGTISVLHPTGGSGSYEFSLDDVNWGSGYFSKLGPGIYTVHIRDANAPACKVIVGDVEIKEPELMTATAVPENVSCFGGSDGQILITDAKNGSGEYEFSIDGVNWIQTSELPFANLKAGDYTVSMRDFNAKICVEVIKTITITQPEKLTATVNPTNVTCYGAKDGKISISAASGGTVAGNYEYTINGLDWNASGDFSNLEPGDYTVVMRDAAVPTCFVDLNKVTITEPPQLTAKVTQTDITCYGANDGIITVSDPKNGLSPYQYSINDGATWTGTSSFTGLLPITYFVWMRDAKGCTQALDTVTIDEPEPLIADVASTDETCLGNDGTITVTNPQNSRSDLYEYSIDNWATWNADGLFTGLASNTYTVLIRDAMLPTCERIIETVKIIEAEPLQATAETSDVTCFGGNDGTMSITTSQGGSGLYEYSINGTTWQIQSFFDGLYAGTYTLTIRDAKAPSCLVTIGSYVIDQPAKLFAEPNLIHVSCYGGNDGSVTMTSPSGGSGTYEYSVNGTDWFTNKIELLIAGTYSVTIRDAAAPTCMANLAPVTINQPPKLFAKVIPTPVSCFGGSDGVITLSEPTNGVGPYQFSIDGGINWQPEMVFAGLKANTYNLLVIQDANKCIAILDPVAVSQPDQIVASYKTTNETLPDTNDGTITVINAKGGSGEHEYSMDGITWQTDPEFTGLAPGTYTVWVGDANVDNCMITLSVQILPAGSITAEYTLQNVTCFGGNDGSITFRNQFGATNYEYSIISGVWQSDAVFSGLVTGSYLLSVRDADNQSNITTLGTVEIGQPAVLNAIATTTNETFNGYNDGSITISNVTGGTAPYEYSINGTNWQTNPLFAGLASGTYMIQIRDAAGCLFSISKIIQPAGSLSAVVSYVNPLCFGDKGSITISKPSGGPAGIAYQYSIDGGNSWQSTGIFPAVSGGVYDVTLGDVSNPAIRILLEKVTITEPKKLLAIFVNYTPPSCLGTSGSFTISATGGTPPYKGIGDFVLPSGASKTYIVSDFNGCVAPAIPVSMPEPVPLVATAVLIPPKCYGDDGTVIISATGGTGNYGKTVGAFKVKPGAKYAFIVKDSSGCQSNVVSGQMPAAPSELIVTISPVGSVCIGTTAKVSVTASGGTPDASGNYTGTGIFDRPVGTHTFTVTDSNGCSKVRTINIGVNEPLAAPIVTVTAPNCYVSSGKIEVTSPLGVNYEYSLDNGTYTSVSTFEKLAPGSTHSLKVKDILTGCESVGISLKIDLMPANPPTPLAKVTVIPSCKNENGTVMVSSPIGVNYEYIMNGKTQTSTEFVNVMTGTYSITVRNILTGCTSIGNIAVPAVPPSPSLSLVSFENPKCYGETGTITFTMTNTPDGLYSIKYVGGQFSNVTVFKGQASVSAPAGMYSIINIEVNGCISDEIINVNITQPSEIVITETITEIDLKSNTKGAINIAVTGGTPFSVTDPYLYKWSNGPTTRDIKNLNEGTYVVLVTDKNGCTQQKLVRIPAPNYPPVARDDEFTTGCSGASGNLFADNGKDIDYDPENDPFFVDVKLVENPKHGTVVINPDMLGSFTYIATPGYTGDDVFRYAIYDENHYQGDTANVVIHVTSDFDGDGIADSDDKDADADGILNVDEVLPGQNWKTADSDGDGHPNWLDIDDDNDGIVDNVEAQSTSDYIEPSGTINKDGVDLVYDPSQGGTKIIPLDTDLTLADPDGIPDFLDADSDNDWVPDYIEGHDQDADGKPDRILSGKDSDSDGLDEAYDIVVNGCNNGNSTGSNSPLQDFDGDGLNDWRDENDDDDEYLTRFEDLNADGDYSNDVTGHVGHPEYLWYGRDCELFIPDAFSPNYDNIHDYFQIYCIESYPNAQMYIFDQVGNKLYEKEHYGNMNVHKTADEAWWDGTTTNRSATRNGNKVVPGTYYYVLRLGNGEVKKSFVFVSY